MPDLNIKHRVAILEKGGVFAAIGLYSYADQLHAVCNFDPRADAAQRFHRASFETRTEAIATFNESVAVTRDRKWTVVYNGEPNVG